MAAYVIILREEPVQDEAEMNEYLRQVSQNPMDPKLKLLAFYGASEAVLGDAPDGVVILEFPTMADAKAWYNSPGYTAARAHRHKSAKHREIFVEGFVPPAG